MDNLLIRNIEINEIPEEKKDNASLYNPAPVSIPVYNNKNNIIKDSVFGKGFNSRELTDEQKKIISQGNQKDLKLFSSIFAAPTYDNEDLFQFDLFGMNNENKINKGENDENFINIERTNNDIKSKVFSNTF